MVRFNGSQAIKEKKYLDPVLIWKVSPYSKPKDSKMKFASNKLEVGKPMKVWCVITVYLEIIFLSILTW